MTKIQTKAEVNVKIPRIAVQSTFVDGRENIMMRAGIGLIAALCLASVVIAVEGAVVISWHENRVDDAKIQEQNAVNREEAKNRDGKKTFHLLSSHINISPQTQTFYFGKSDFSSGWSIYSSPEKLLVARKFKVMSHQI